MQPKTAYLGLGIIRGLLHGLGPLSPELEEGGGLAGRPHKVNHKVNLLH